MWRRNTGSDVTGTTMPEMSSRIKYKPLLAARLTSARREPASAKPMPAQPADARSKMPAHVNAPATPPWGRHPSANATTASTTTWMISVTMTPAIFAPISRRVPSGVTCSLRSTPKLRSNPVAIERATNEVERTHNAKMPGAMKSTRFFKGVEVTCVFEKNTSNNTGIPMVSSKVSPRRMVIRTSASVWNHQALMTAPNVARQ